MFANITYLHTVYLTLNKALSWFSDYRFGRSGVETDRIQKGDTVIFVDICICVWDPWIAHSK